MSLFDEYGRYTADLPVDITIVSVRCADKPVPAAGSQVMFCYECGKPMWVGRVVIQNAKDLGCVKPDFLCEKCNNSPLFDISNVIAPITPTPRSC